MNIADVIPLVESLTHADKFKLMQILLAQLAKEEGVSLQINHHPKKDDAILEIIGIAEGDDDAVARHHDKYLYGAK